MNRFLEAVFDYLKRPASAGELEALSRDLALAPTELRELSNARPGTRDQLVAMAKRFGVTPMDIDRERWRALDIAQACRNCTSARQCGKFLAGNDNLFDPMTSCPNAGHYKELAEAHSG